MIPMDAILSALRLLPPKLTSPAALVMLITIGFQESRFRYRYQIGGPARGFWQFELNGVTGVLNHKASAKLARELCAARGVVADAAEIHRALAVDDVLAAGFARLLLWTDARALPEDNAEAGWRYYIFNWRPGRPHRHTWDKFYEAAKVHVEGLQ